MMPVPFGQHLQVHLNTQMERLPYLRYHFYTESTNEVSHRGLSVASRCQLFICRQLCQAGWARDFTLSPCDSCYEFCWVFFMYMTFWEDFLVVFSVVQSWAWLILIVSSLQKVFCSRFTSCVFVLSFFSPFMAPEKNREHHLYKLT